MGGICSKRSLVDKSPSESTLDPNGLKDPEPLADKGKTKGVALEQTTDEAMERRMQEQTSDDAARTMRNTPVGAAVRPQLQSTGSGVFRKSKSMKTKLEDSMKAGTTKASEVSSLLGKAGTAGLGKAVGMLDTLGSSMSSLNLGGNFASGMGTKGNKITILAFEVANTIVKAANLMSSLSKENIKHLKETVLPSEGVQNLVSRDMNELLRLASSDKREELKVLSKEVVRFGNRCKDPQWHNLDRYFDRLASEFTPQSQLEEGAKSAVQQLMVDVQCTAELYHELHAMDRFEQDYRRKHNDDENSGAIPRGDSVQFLKQELKIQQKHVKSLKKHSLWSKSLEEVMEKLVDIIHFLHLEIHSAFGCADLVAPAEVPSNGHVRLGPASLALHYANVISQISSLVSRSSSVPPNIRDSLYHSLPSSIRSAMRPRLQSCEVKEELTVSEIREEMEKTMRWLVPMATSTTRAHHGFGWVGEWANIGSEVHLKMVGQNDLIRIETLYHADKEKTEEYILDLVVWLHHLISLSKPLNGGTRSPIKSPARSPAKMMCLTISPPASSSPSILTQEDEEMLQYVKYRKSVPGISKSQEFCRSKFRLSKHDRLSKSSNHSQARRLPALPVISFDIDPAKALDVIDRVDDITKL